MKVRISLAVALLVGVVAGAVGAWALCNEGYCGDDSTTSDQGATRTAAVFGAGEPATPSSNASASASPAGTQVPEDAGATPTEERRREITEITGLAMIGDSVADEYRAGNPRGGEYGETTLNWIEILARENRVNMGEWSDFRPEPRRAGYEFNWARSGATSETMIESGQHTGVAEQVKAGQVSHVIIQIGINDFYWDDVALSIYSGDLSGDALQEFLDGIVANIELAVKTVKATGNDNIIVASSLDFVTPQLVPGISEVLPDDGRRQWIVDSFAYVNQGLVEMAAREEVVFFDFNAALERELEGRYDPDDRRFILVGGERIDVSTKGNEPHHLLVDDEWAHPGTVFSGLIANLYIEQMNAVFGTAIAPFSDEEILQVAGIRDTACVERGQVTAQ